MSLWGWCLALLTRSIIVFANVCQKNVAMRVRQRREKTTLCGVVYACRDVRDYASIRLSVNLSTLYTFACKLLNISVLKRVDKPALCVHYCLHAARIMIVVCTVCTMLVARCFCLFVQMLLKVVSHGTHGIGGACFLSEWQVFRSPYAGCTLCRYSKVWLASSKSADTCVDKKRCCLHA